MSRKDYILIATAIREQREVEARLFPSPESPLDSLAYRLADALHRDNPAFNRIRFLKACGVDV